jgi:hypothetical protein
MPAVEIGIGLLHGQVVVTLPAIVDSGSDATIVPVSYLRQIRASSYEKRWLRGIRGGRHRVKLYSIFVQIGSYSLFARVVGDEVNREIIIGRDILNQFIVTLNGLASVVEISQ